MEYMYEGRWFITSGPHLYVINQCDMVLISLNWVYPVYKYTVYRQELIQAADSHPDPLTCPQPRVLQFHVSLKAMVLHCELGYRTGVTCTEYTVYGPMFFEICRIRLFLPEFHNSTKQFPGCNFIIGPTWTMPEPLYYCEQLEVGGTVQ